MNTAKEDSVKQQTISVAKDHPHVDNIDDYDDEIVVETLVPGLYKFFDSFILLLYKIRLDRI